MEILQPPGWMRPEATRTASPRTGRMVFVSGMSAGMRKAFRTTDFAGQVRQALANVVAVLAEADARPEHIVRMTWYVCDKRKYVAAYPGSGSHIVRSSAVISRR